MLADDIGFDHFCDADCDVSLERCYRVDNLRVDCVMTFATDDDWRYVVIATALVGELLEFGEYWVRGHPHLSRALIKRWPPGFRTRPIAVWYAETVWTSNGYKRFRPDLLILRHVGYGRPRLAAVIRNQCRVQPRLHCAVHS